MGAAAELVCSLWWGGMQEDSAPARPPGVRRRRRRGERNQTRMLRCFAVSRARARTFTAVRSLVLRAQSEDNKSPPTRRNAGCDGGPNSSSSLVGPYSRRLKPYERLLRIKIYSLQFLFFFILLFHFLFLKVLGYLNFMNA